MNHVHTEQQGDAQAAVLYGKFLHFADVLHAFQVEQTSDFTVADFTGNVAALGLSGDDVSRYRQVELTDFLVQRHFAHQLRNEFIHLLRIALGCVFFGRCRHGEGRESQGC